MLLVEKSTGKIWGATSGKVLRWNQQAREELLERTFRKSKDSIENVNLYYKFLELQYCLETNNHSNIF